MIKVAVVGVGRTGSLAVKSLFESGFSIVSAFSSPTDSCVGKDVGLLAGVGMLGVPVTSSAKLDGKLAETKPEVVVDFTNAQAFMENLPVISKRKINIVVGTTGFSESQLSEIKETGEKQAIGIVLSPNMSVGVNVFWGLCREAAKSLKGYDVEIIDKHHRFKKDSPSGTALKAAQIIAKAQGLEQGEFVYGRKGASLRAENEIGIHAIRAGNIVGEHTVIFASQTERIELTHIANTREAFSQGAAKAVEFIRNKKGFYDMGDVLGLKI
jgi:4-hydroxy-tetrahydrodipicolinate reductase